MKKVVLILALVLFTIPFYSQEIVTNVDIEYDEITIGEDVEISFDVNYITDCDSYYTSIEVDYDFMEIVVKVDYSYDSDCEESDWYTSESINTQLLLEGTFDVSIECDVAFESSLDQDIDLGELTVEAPDNSDCFESTPYLSEFCPSNNHNVCACNGQNYENECEAYLEDENGTYFDFNCGDYLKDNSEEFECGNYSVNGENVFANYECDYNEFNGNEKYFKYEHKEDGDSLLVFFNAKSKTTRLFLTKLSFGDIKCINVSDKNRLYIESLDKGTYYIIVDSERDYSQNIEICSPNLVNSEYFSQKINIYPNPISDYINIYSSSVIKSIHILNHLGIDVFNKQLDKKNIKIEKRLNPGVYFINIRTEYGIENRKLIVD